MTTRVMLLYARLGTGPGMVMVDATGDVPVRNYFGPFFVWWTKPPVGRSFPLALCGYTEISSAGTLRTPGDTVARVRGVTPKPPATVTITAPTELPIPAQLTGSVTGT